MVWLLLGQICLSAPISVPSVAIQYAQDDETGSDAEPNYTHGVSAGEYLHRATGTPGNGLLENSSLHDKI